MPGSHGFFGPSWDTPTQAGAFDASDTSARLIAKHAAPHARFRGTVFTAPLVAGLAIFVVSFLYVLPAATDFIDDHFMHVAWGRQLLKGRLPVRDMVALGMPLQAALSAAAEIVVGYRLLSEGLIIGLAFAAGGVLTYALARRASGSIWIGVLAAALLLAASPRTYSYPKITLYAAVLLLLWRYIDRPTRGRAAALAAAITAAFYLRHDHAIYVTTVTAVILTLWHRGDWRRLTARLALVGLLALAAVAPYLAFVQYHLGLAAWYGELRSAADREYHQNRFEAWPRWPLSSLADVVRWTPAEQVTARIGIRWSEDASDEMRREASTRYGIRVPVEADHLESGRFVLTDISRDNVLALLDDPAIQDTAGIDRQTGEINIPGLRIGAIHLLPGVDTPPESAALLFYLIIGFVTVTVIALHPRMKMRGRLADSERIKIAAVVLVAIVTAFGFIREPLSIRIADALVAPIVLAAWWTGVGLRGGHGRGRDWLHVARTGVLATLLLLLMARSVAVIGNVAVRMNEREDWSTMMTHLMASPPFDGWSAVGSAKYEVVRYVRQCTARDEPLLVLWFAPDLYYYADRPFAGRLTFYLEGYWTSPAQQQRNIAAIDRDRPTLALLEAGRETTDLYTHPMVLDYLRRHYREIGEVTAADGNTITVHARTDRTPVSVDPDHGWPCYR